MTSDCTFLVHIFVSSPLLCAARLQTPNLSNLIKGEPLIFCQTSALRVQWMKANERLLTSCSPSQGCGIPSPQLPRVLTHVISHLWASRAVEKSAELSRTEQYYGSSGQARNSDLVRTNPPVVLVSKSKIFSVSPKSPPTAVIVLRDI
jgi:hypothetical protein